MQGCRPKCSSAPAVPLKRASRCSETLRYHEGFTSSGGPRVHPELEDFLDIHQCHYQSSKHEKVRILRHTGRMFSPPAPVEAETPFLTFNPRRPISQALKQFICGEMVIYLF